MASRQKPTTFIRSEPSFGDLLKKHRRPVTLREALKESARMQPANDQPKATVHRLRRG